MSDMGTDNLFRKNSHSGVNRPLWSDVITKVKYGKSLEPKVVKFCLG